MKNKTYIPLDSRYPVDHRKGNLAAMKGWDGGWRRVFICNQYSDKERGSREKLINYCLFVKEHFCVPVAPFLYYPIFMNEYDSDERVKTRFFALRDLFNCEEVWVFGKKLSEDMEFYLRFAKYRGITVRWFPDWDEILEAESDMNDDEDEEEDEDE